MKISKDTKKSARLGFTLIELLATLTIMAVIAAILFPFVTNYTKKANRDTALRSLRILQDAMDRYRAVNEKFTGWPIGTGTAGSTLSGYHLLATAQVDTVLGDIANAGTNQTLRLPTDGITNTHIVLVSTTDDQVTAGWEVMRYRRATNMDGVDRKGNDITNGFLTPSAGDIDAAFQNN